MADQTATVVYDPGTNSPDQMIKAFADAKAEDPAKHRFLLTLVSNERSAEDREDSAVDASNDFAPSLPPGSPDFNVSSEKAEPPAPSGGDFDVSLEAPAE